MPTREGIQKEAELYSTTKLSKLQAEIWVAKWHHEMKPNEIAEVLGKTGSHIRVQLGRISAKLAVDPTIRELAGSIV